MTNEFDWGVDFVPHNRWKEQPPKTHIQEFEDDARQIYNELLNTLVTKQIDYGPFNVWHSPGGPVNGLMVRMSDKMERLKNLLYKSIDPNHESISDSFADLANYAVIAIMVERGIWEKHAKKSK